MNKKTIDDEKLDAVVARARQERETRERGYRTRALRLLPWICGRCQREFDERNVSELTVHHRDHDHDNNPADGSNWELLCLYCHDDEHQRSLGQAAKTGGENRQPGRYQPFADLRSKLDQADE